MPRWAGLAIVGVKCPRLPDLVLLIGRVRSGWNVLESPEIPVHTDLFRFGTRVHGLVLARSGASSNLTGACCGLHL